MPSTTYALDHTWRPILKDLGLSSSHVLRRAGLPEDLLTQPGVRLKATDFHRFWDGMGRELNDPLFPLRLCQAIRSESFSPPLFAALCSPNFWVAVQRIARFKALVAPMRLDLRQDAGTVTLSLVWPDRTARPPPSLVLTELLFFVVLARIGSRERICPLRVVTDEPPAEQALYAEFFGVGVEHGEGHHLTFRQADALCPFLTSNDGLWTSFEPELRTRLAELDGSVPTGERVRAVLLEALPSGLIAADRVASKLALSKRTLQRQLEAEGTTYMKVLQETRAALATHYLQQTRLSAPEISFLLGFEEPNSFYRAFREWTGRSPDQVRQQLTLTA
ncbi:MAG: AraC family transcriptional regulator [Rhodoferax sp.]|nr:AraC family transcriptional regulator [Rhodoferax sp.]